MQRLKVTGIFANPLVSTRFFGWRLGRFAVHTLVWQVCVVAQTTLQISSPSPGTAISPGQQFNVAVIAGPSSGFAQVFVVAQNLGASSVLSTPPYSFSFSIPPTGFTGATQLTAVGAAFDGSLTFSAPVIISVEPLSPPTSLSVSPVQLAFSYDGQQVGLIVTGHFADGTSTILTQSPQVVYQSLDLTVATVANDGTVTATGTGSTNIRASYGMQSVLVSVTVPKKIRGDLNGDGKVDQDDLNILLDALNQPAVKPVDARDLNGDGVINALDSRILVTLCTHAGCATH